MDQIHFGKLVTGDRALYSIYSLVEDSGAIISGSGWAPKQLIRLRSWRLPEHVGRYALYSISGGLCASGVTISVFGTRGLKCPLFYFRSFGAKMDLAGSCTCGNGSRAWPNSQGDTCAEQTKECVWNGVLIRPQHSTAKPSVIQLWSFCIIF